MVPVQNEMHKPTSPPSFSDFPGITVTELNNRKVIGKTSERASLMFRMESRRCVLTGEIQGAWNVCRWGCNGGGSLSITRMEAGSDRKD